MSKEEKIKAVAEFLVASDAHLSIKLSMNPEDPTVKKWVKMRDALGLSGWATADDAEYLLKGLLSE